MEGKQVRRLLLNQRRGDGNLEIGESSVDDDKSSVPGYVLLVEMIGIADQVRYGV